MTLRAIHLSEQLAAYRTYLTIPCATQVVRVQSERVDAMTMAYQSAHQLVHVLAATIHRPHFDGTVPRARVDEASATPLHTLYRVHVTADGRLAQPGLQVPHLHRAVLR